MPIITCGNKTIDAPSSFCYMFSGTPTVFNYIGGDEPVYQSGNGFFMLRKPECLWVGSLHLNQPGYGSVYLPDGVNPWEPAAQPFVMNYWELKGLTCTGTPTQPSQNWCLWCTPEGDFDVVLQGTNPPNSRMTMKRCSTDKQSLINAAPTECPRTTTPASEYCLWCSSEKGSYQVIPSQYGPPDNTYAKIQCGPSQSELENIGNASCRIIKEDDSCCDKLEAILERITKILEGPERECGGKIGECCSKIDSCIPHIIEEINKVVSQTSMTCYECAAKANTSFAGTLEYAVACARYAGTVCDPENECKSSADDGKKCSKCNQEKCCCKGGTCGPCEPEKPEKQVYLGWCRPSDHAYTVTKKEDPNPGTGYIISNSGENQEEVLTAARNFCSQSPQPSPPPTGPPPQLPTFNSKVCDLSIYSSSAGIAQLLGDSQSINLGSALLQTSDLAAKSLSNAVSFLPPAQALVEGLYGIAKLPFVLAEGLTPPIASALGCNESQWRSVYQTMVAFGYVEKQLGVDLSEAKTPWRYAFNSLCPNKFTDFQSTLAAYFGNSINYDSAKTLARMEGHCQQSLDWMIHCGKAKPLPLQLAVLRRRKIISPSEYETGMRELGYIDSSHRGNLFKLTEQVPTTSELIRMMVRDADDDKLVKKFNLGAEFENKFKGQLKQWSEDQGISQKQMEYNWYAHWSIPSPSQLFEFWHRLRNNPKFGTKEQQYDDIKAALIQQDILPYWHDKYLAVSFHPLTRVDARRAFELGALDEKALKESYLDQGYSDDNADVLVRFNERRREITAQGHKAIKLWQKGLIKRADAYGRMTKEGLPGAVVVDALNAAESGFVSSPQAQAFVKGDLNREELIEALIESDVRRESAEKIVIALSFRVTKSQAIKQYEHGTISNEQAFVNAAGDGMHPAVINRLLSEIDKKIDDNIAAVCQKGIRRRFILGEFGEQDAADKLVKGGLTNERAGKLIQAWKCEQSSIGKHIPAATLCKYLSNGIIDAQEFIKRARLIGFSELSASMMLTDCLAQIGAKRMKDAEKQIKEDVAAEQKLQRELARQQSAAAAEAGRLQRAQEKAAATRQMRDKIMIQAAEALALASDTDLYTALGTAKSTLKNLVETRGFCTTDAYKILQLAVDGWNGGELSEFQQYADIVASAGTPACLIQPEAV